MSATTIAGNDNYRMNVLPLRRNTDESTSISSDDRNDLYFESDEILSRLAEIKSKWSTSERIARKMIGRARRERLAAMLLQSKVA